MLSKSININKYTSIMFVLYFDVWNDDGTLCTVARLISSIPPWFRSGITYTKHGNGSFTVSFSSSKRYNSFVKWLRRQQRALRKRYNAFFPAEVRNAYTSAVALINEKEDMFDASEFTIFLGLPDDEISPAHFKKVAEMLYRLRGSQNPPDKLQSDMLEQYKAMPPDKEVVMLLRQIKLLRLSLPYSVSIPSPFCKT